MFFGIVLEGFLIFVILIGGYDCYIFEKMWISMVVFKKFGKELWMKLKLKCEKCWD